ncbi:MAG: hypothetical protein QXD57_03945 [Ignisphaera sp.]
MVKTTLARTIIKLVPITDGKIIFEGIDISKLKREAINDAVFKVGRSCSFLWSNNVLHDY